MSKVRPSLKLDPSIPPQQAFLPGSYSFSLPSLRLLFSPKSLSLYACLDHPTRWALFTISLIPHTPARTCLQTPNSSHLQDISTCPSLRHLQLNESKPDFVTFSYKPVRLVEFSTQRRRHLPSRSPCRKPAPPFPTLPRIQFITQLCPLGFPSIDIPRTAVSVQRIIMFITWSASYLVSLPPLPSPNPWSILCTTTRLEQNLTMLRPCSTCFRTSRFPQDKVQTLPKSPPLFFTVLPRVTVFQLHSLQLLHGDAL